MKYLISSETLNRQNRSFFKVSGKQLAWFVTVNRSDGSWALRVSMRGSDGRSGFPCVMLCFFFPAVKLP